MPHATPGSLVVPVVVLAGLSLAGCGVDDDDHHDFAEVTAGDGSKRLALTSPGSWDPAADVVAAGDQQTVQYDGAPAYDGGSNCSGNATPGARTLRDVLVAAFPQIDSIGIYNCRVIAGTNSMSIHGVGRALDVMISPIGGDADNGAGDPIAAFLMTHAEEIGLQGIIFDHTIWTTSRAAGSRVRAYTGSNPHVDHLHIEINEEASFENLPWYGNPTGPGPAPECEALPPEGGVVDAGPCQQRFGPGQYWRTEAAGAGGQHFWTHAVQGDSPSNWARTTVKVEGGGRFDVEVKLDPAFAQFATTRYRVTGSGEEQVVVVDQGARCQENNGWALLGTFNVPTAGLTVVVEDNSETTPPAAKKIVLDAVRVSLHVDDPIDPPPDEPTEPEEPTSEPTSEPTPEEPSSDPGQPEPTPEGPVLDDDDEGTVEESRVVIVNRAQPSCAASPSTSSPALLGLLLAGIGLRRRRR
jgi:MYXO-CTERM domain-containing protein